MRKKKSLEVDNFFSELRDSRRERVVLRAKQLHFGLEVGQPLLLALATLKRGDTALTLVFK